MNDFHDPTIQVESATPPAAPALVPGAYSAAALRRFGFLEEHGAAAHLDSLRSPAMVPTLALERVAATLPAEGARQVAIQPRRGPAFYIVLHRIRGVVHIQD